MNDYTVEINELKDTIVKTLNDIAKLEEDKKIQNKSFAELIKKKKIELNAYLKEIKELEEAGDE